MTRYLDIVRGRLSIRALVAASSLLARNEIGCEPAVLDA